MQARKTVDDYVTRSRYQARGGTGSSSRTNTKSRSSSNDGFLDGVRRGGLASLSAYVLKFSSCAPIYAANADVLQPMSPSFSFGGGYAFGNGTSVGDKTAGVMMYLASLAPEVSLAAGSGQYKEAAMMAGTKTLIALSGTGLGHLTKTLFKRRTYNTK
ncbi:hypothetical protein HOC35_07325 [Candidatus Woesearchaeota archaeon]|nr:hypothetical protein [Candidatus Woesearchaeota archaeon]